MINESELTVLKEIKKFAKEEEIPIMESEGIEYLTKFVVRNNIKNVLELGTAIGYSAIMMALANRELRITTVERDHERYLEAVKNVKKLELEDRITLLFSDAIDLDFAEKFDLIFLDAAKGQNINFFEKFEYNLNDGGSIITDNISFHGLVEKDDEEIKSKKLRTLVEKIREYIEFLKNKKDYTVEFLDIGDGIAVATKNEEE